jgi:uncharacterized protein (DUF1778 family)
MSTIPPSFLSELLSPLADCFTPDVAQEVVNLRFDAQIQEKLESLRQKSQNGALSASEQAELDALSETADVIAILQAKSQVLLHDYTQQSMEAATPTHLSERDREVFLSLLDAPPAPNQALTDAFSRLS